MSEEKIQVLIVDDHLIVRQGLKLIFETEERIEVVGEAEDGLQAVQLAAELEPDIILMDLQMPNLDGLSAVNQILEHKPESTIIILTTYNEDELMFKCLRAGAKGFLLKDTGRDALMNTIYAAMRGETLLKPEIMQKILAFPQRKPQQAPSSNVLLSEREQEVLQAAANGSTNNQIALALGISERTVRAHLTNIYNKFGVSSRGAAIGYAAQHGLLES